MGLMKAQTSDEVWLAQACYKSKTRLKGSEDACAQGDLSPPQGAPFRFQQVQKSQASRWAQVTKLSIQESGPLTSRDRAAPKC